MHRIKFSLCGQRYIDIYFWQIIPSSYVLEDYNDTYAPV